MGRNILDGLEDDIEEIFLAYLRIASTTNTGGEKDVEPFWREYFSRNPYFQAHQEFFGAYPVADDILGRKVLFAFLRGSGPDTVVFLHHHDVVDTEDFKTLQKYAYDPEGIARELGKIKETLPDEAAADLAGEEYFFGRGTADMKGGGSIQMALLDRYARQDSFNGNVMLISVPDEENLSAGMRSAVSLLAELKERYGLEYLMAFNSEPYQRTEKDEGVIDEGSIGKTLFFFYVRGALAHAGRVFEGVNALSILSEIAVRTESNMELADALDGEVSMPPTWLYLRDRKACYDVSLPLGAGGYLSTLSLTSDAEATFQKLKDISREAAAAVMSGLDAKYRKYCDLSGKSFHPLAWDPKAVSFSELYQEAYSVYGQAFIDNYEAKYQEISDAVVAGKMDMLESNLQLTEFVFNYIDDLSPRVVIGISQPYYPHVTNSGMEKISGALMALPEKLLLFAQEELGERYIREKFFTGISDLSYTSVKNAVRIHEMLQGNMPHFGRLYSLPFSAIEKISMPGMNIGPRGKDLHKLTERVLKKDLLYNTPRLLHYAVSTLLK